MKIVQIRFKKMKQKKHKKKKSLKLMFHSKKSKIIKMMDLNNSQVSKTQNNRTHLDSLVISLIIINQNLNK